MIEGKVWGTTEPVLISPLFEMHRLVVKPMHQCSMHVHHRKWNCFLVVEGELFINIERGDYALTDTTRLGPGDITTVRPGEHHRFYTGHESCVAYECYYTEPLSNDIARRDIGGPTVPDLGTNEPNSGTLEKMRGTFLRGTFRETGE